MADKRAGGFWRIILLLLCALVLGSAIGLYLGWDVWPVYWFNAAPSDLTLEGQLDYVVLAADSYAITNDLETAQLRLFELTDEDTSWNQVANLGAFAAQYEASQGRVSSAERVDALSEAIGWDSTAVEIYEHPSEADNQTLLLILGGAALLGLVGIVLIWPRQKKERLVAAEVTTPSDVAPVSKRPLSKREKSSSEATPVIALPTDEPAEGESLIDKASAMFAEPVVNEDVPAADEQPVLSEIEVQPVPNSEVKDSSALDEILTIMNGYAGEEDVAESEQPPQRETAHYALGDDDYAVSFNIEGVEGTFLGECGVNVAEVLASTSLQHVVAFEVWVFDRSDVQTVSQLLCSEWAMYDTDMRVLLESRGELVAAQEGTTITLERLSTVVTFTVTKVVMGQEAGLPPDAWFERLDVDVQIDIKQAPSV